MEASYVSYVELDTSKAPTFKTKVALRNFILPVLRFRIVPWEHPFYLNGDEYRIDIAVTVPDRTTGGPFTLQWALYVNANMPEKDIVAMIRYELRNMLIHELEEAWHVDGERVGDPHDMVREAR